MVVRLTSGDNIRFALSDIAAIEFAAVGHEAVDLGLSVRWASCNVGAENPEDLGGGLLGLDHPGDLTREIAAALFVAVDRRTAQRTDAERFELFHQICP